MAAVADPVRYSPTRVEAFWRAVRVLEDTATRIERTCSRFADDGARAGVEQVSAAVTVLHHSLSELVVTAHDAGVPPEHSDRVDEDSERWFTAIHEAAHAVVAVRLGHRVRFAGATTDTSGVTSTARHATGLAAAVIAVAGQQATRMELGGIGGAVSDYARAEQALAGTGWSLEQAEAIAVDILRANRGAVIALARRIYRTGRENNIN